MSIAEKLPVRYRLAGRYLEGNEIVGYHLISSNGESLRCKKSDVEKLAERGLIDNCRLIEYNGVNYIKGVGIRISELPVMNLRTSMMDCAEGSRPQLTITKRIVNGNNVEGYVVVDQMGKSYRLSKEKVWQLARQKLISNAMAQLCGKQKILRGIGIELRNLPTIQVVAPR